MPQPSFKTEMDNSEVDDFLSKNGLESAERQPLAGDASRRRYERIIKDNSNFMLMIAPPGQEDVRPFIKVDKILRQANLNAPEIIAEDLDNGLLLLEDFGDDLYSRVLPDKANELEIYTAAVNILDNLPETKDLAPYSVEKMLTESVTLVDWFAPEAGREEFLNIWKELIAKIDGTKKSMVMLDFHADNLIWLPEREGLMKVGLLDFQDAVIGHAAYDYVSLLEDARRDVGKAVVSEILKDKSSDFMKDYFILGAQRNCKIIGYFHRLNKRDGKPNYLKFLPRVWEHLRGDLKHPALAPLKMWFEKNVDAQT